MESNRKVRLGSKMLGTIVVLLIAASWIGNVWYFYSMQLDKPVFLKHYMTLNGNVSDRLELRYLENKGKGKKVTGIQLEELPMLRFEILPQPYSYRHQVLGQAYAVWSAKEVEHMEKVPLTIREATVYYSEGPPERVAIGEITVSWDERGGLLQMSSSGGSSDGTGHYSVIFKEPLTLKEVDYSFSDRLNSIFQLEVSSDGNKMLPQLPTRLTGEGLTFSYKWTIPDDSPSAYEVYKTEVMLTFETEDRKTVYDHIPINFNHYPNEKQVKQLVRSGGELD